MIRRTLALLSAAVALSALPACSGGAGGLFGKSEAELAMQALAPAIRDAANNYTNSLKELAAMLQNINDPQQAMQALNKIEPLVSRAADSSRTLQSLNPTDRSNVAKAFGSQISGANNGFLSQFDRLKASSGGGLGGFGSAGQALSPVLSRVPIFRP
jgi:hypothetical protein